MNRVVIIEDEPNSQKLLQIMIKDYAPNLILEGVAPGVQTGIELINKTKPDVVFLDIEIQGGTSFDILDALPAPLPKIIFITGYDHYAIKAIRYSALDYLLKPINIEEFKGALARIGKNLEAQKEKVEFFKDQLGKSEEELDKIVLSGNGEYRVLPFSDILYLEAKGAYVIFYTRNGEQLFSPHNLSYYEQLLPVISFFRVHKSYIVNLKKVTGYERGRGGSAFLENDLSLPIAFRRKAVFIKLLGDL